MKDFGNGWSGLKEYMLKCGAATTDDTDDAICAKIKRIVRDTLPEPEAIVGQTFDDEDSDEDENNDSSSTTGGATTSGNSIGFGSNKLG